MGKRIKATEAYENRFYRIPKAFFKTEKYKDMSLEAKVVYGFLDDRRELSLKNKWIDEEGYIYLIFTRKEVQEMLCLSDKPVTRAFKELKQYELIDEVRQGLNKPNLIYVCHIDFENIEDMRIRINDDSKIGESSNPGIGENTIQGSEEIRCNDTDLNKTDKKDIYITLTSNGDERLFLYNSYYKAKFNKEHMKIKDSSYIDVEIFLGKLDDFGVEIEDFEDAVKEHFSKLPKSNNGNILAFIKASKRYLEIDPEDPYKIERPKTNSKFNNFSQRKYTDEYLKHIEAVHNGWEVE